MSSSELRNRSHPSAHNANPLNKWASNKEAIQALPSNLKVANRDLSSTRNLQINFLKCNGVIAPVSNAIDNAEFTLDVSTLTYFVNYTDFNKLNPDTSVVVYPQVFSDWYTNYTSAKITVSNINPYEPSAIVSYHDNTGKKLNYICKIKNIVKKSDGYPLFTFDTSKVVFYDSSSYSKKGENIAVPIVNNPEISKIDTNFLPGTFINIRIDFDPLPDPSYDYNGDISFFLQSDMTIVKSGNGNYVASMPLSGNFVGYRNWTPSILEQDLNQELEVYVDNISYFTHMFEKVYSNRTDTPQNSFKPSTTLEFMTKDRKTYTCIVQITDSYIYKDNVIFNLNNEIVQMYDLPKGSVDPSPTLVSSYKSITKILNEGHFTQVRMDIDCEGCGYLGSAYSNAENTYLYNTPPTICGANEGCSYEQGCHWKWWGCCTTYGACPDSCNCSCNDLLRSCGASSISCDIWISWIILALGGFASAG